MTDCSISCIVPTFDAARSLVQTLGSILAQTLPPSKVIVVDDGSSDRTAEIIKSFGSPVVYIHQDNHGPAASRNLGVQQSCGQFVSFLDQDDLWHPEKLERQMARFSVRPDLDMCITHVQLFWSDDLKREQMRYHDLPRGNKVPGYATTTLLTRRDVFDKVGLLDTNLWFSDATNWFIRAKEMGLKLELMAELLVYHRMHGMNLTRRRCDASRDVFVHIIKDMLDRRRGAPQPNRSKAIKSHPDS